METKLCKKCNTARPLTDFQKMTRSKDGLQAWCRACMKKQATDWRKDHREEYNRKRRELNIAMRAAYYAQLNASVSVDNN